MTSTLSRNSLELHLGGGPAVIVGGEGADVSWGHDLAGVELVAVGSQRDLLAVAERACGVVLSDPALVPAAVELGLTVILRRAETVSVEAWLAAPQERVILCESDLAVVRQVPHRPVFADISENVGLAPAAVAAGAAGLLLAPDAPAPDVQVAREAVTLVGALLRPETPATLAACRDAIDRVDAALATLLERRAALAGIVQTLKPVGGFAGRDMDRERRLVAAMAERAPDLGEVRLAPIMNAVIEAGLHLAEERRSASAVRGPRRSDG